MIRIHASIRSARSKSPRHLITAQLLLSHRHSHTASSQTPMKISSATPRAAGSGMRKSSSASAIDALMSKNFRMPLPGRWEAHPDASNKVVMARIPHPNAGPATYATASDVAVMEFARTVLDIPVPKVLDWNASVAGYPVEAEYVLTEAPSETPLGDLWSKMKPSERKSIIEEVVELEQKLLSAELNLSGSIYFADNGFAGSKPAEIIRNAPSSIRDLAKNRFVIGPSVHCEFWERQNDEMNIDRGPCEKKVPGAIAHREMAWIPKYGEKYPHDNRYTYAPSQSSPQEHIELLKRYISVVPMLLPKSPELLRPTLRNLISAGTVCSYGMEKSRARKPSLVSHRGEGIRERPDNFNELDEHEQERITDKIKRTATQDSYMMQTSLENPLLSRALDVPQREVLGHLVAFAGDSWNADHGFMKLRESLLKVLRRWDLFRMEGPKPYRFTDEESSNTTKVAKDSTSSRISGIYWMEPLTGKDSRSMKISTAQSIFSPKCVVHVMPEGEGEDREEWERWTQWVVERKKEREERNKSE
ncbi:uncharacterized protein CIMG_12707 [Coccidioides immitis RS]|uniref:Aminoglycoside phosphotransferase domain-containing protein n=1 Tax=Coccidioides immitis (strain RS) TaxID=246410 RepID=J3KKZ3_COCIM|nr:uncharacterized protein CIMG_12707 [Coccidioides immitis RS]EAS36906.3 hypothetical protein CIMG_12707 [Coccidioides immitis RS]